MNISIFGLGYVGCVSLGCLAQNGHNLIGVDTNPSKVNLINNGIPTIVEKDIDRIIKSQFDNGRIRATENYIDAVVQSDITIIAVGTPSSVNGHLDLSFIYNVAKNISEGLKEKNKFHVIAVRSTVMPGTVEKISAEIEKHSGKKKDKDFAVLSNPEFLREGTAVNDYYNPPFTLIGSDNPEGAAILSDIYKEINSELIITEVRVAEIIKYINNSFHALKISFANEIGNICKALEIDSHKVMNIFSKDRILNISPYYLKPGFAYGGSCLPKDLKALQTISHDNYLDTPVLNNINKSNDIQINRAVNLITDFKKSNIGFLGFSFKAGTDDLRNSPTVKVIESLLGKGYSIKIYDSNVAYSKLTGRNKDYIDAHLPHLQNLLADTIEEIYEDSDIIVVTINDPVIIDFISRNKNKIIVDFIRLANEAEIIFDDYCGLNW